MRGTGLMKCRNNLEAGKSKNSETGVIFMNDKLDRIRRDEHMHSNLIKWWNVKIEEPEGKEIFSEDEANSISGEDVRTSGLSDEERAWAKEIVQGGKYDDAYEEAMVEVKNREANEIYERLMREAREDEEKKQAEIEAAKKIHTE